MANQLSFRSNGTAELMLAHNPAWHGLGTVLAYCPRSAEAMVTAGQDWETLLEEIYLANGKRVPDSFATVRSDTGAVLGVVGPEYKPVHNREAFAFLDGLVADGFMTYESAGCLKGGRVVWMLARMPEVDTIAEGDDSSRFALFSTSHDGSGAVTVALTSERVVCANTLRIALGGAQASVSFRHSGDIAQKMEAAKRYISQFSESFELFRDQARILATRRYTPDQAREYINTLFPEVDKPGRGRTIRENKVQQVRDNFVNPRNSLPSIKGTWWALVNSVTESVDHDGRRDYSTREARENRFLSVLTGAGADFKARAFDLARAMAG